MAFGLWNMEDNAGVVKCVPKIKCTYKLYHNIERIIKGSISFELHEFSSYCNHFYMGPSVFFQYKV